MLQSIRLGMAALAFGGLLALPTATLADGPATALSAGMHAHATGGGAHRGAGARRSAHARGHARPGSRVGGGFGVDLQAAATALKLTLPQLQQQLRSGKSIAQVAQAQNVPLQTVKDAITAAARSRLDQQVAAGRLASAQETQRLNALQANLDQRLNATGGQHPMGSGTPGSTTSSAPPSVATSGS